MNRIIHLAEQFRNAIDIAYENGDFEFDICFRDFPRGCCGDTCDLLGEFLLRHGVKTCYICGCFENGQTHAWLLTDDDIIVDITGDQFKDNFVFLNYNISVYVGKKDKFHDLFEVAPRDVRENVGINVSDGMCASRLRDLYRKIIKYI